MSPIIGKRRTRNVIAVPVPSSQPESYDAAAVDRAIGEVAEATAALIDRPATFSITAGTVTISRPAITLVAGAGVTITLVDDPANNAATITITSP